jgi:integrase
MASLELRSDRYRIVFRFAGKKFQTPLKTTEEKEAQGCLSRLEENLRLVERGRLIPPPDADLPTFLLSDGQIAQKPVIVNDVLTLDGLVTEYMAVHSNGALEANTLATRDMHLRHLKDTLGDKFPVKKLKPADLQGHVTRRSKAFGIRKRKLSAYTMRKEISSFRTIWNWAVQRGLVSTPFPNQGIVFPKMDEKPPFQSWEEIERQIKRGGLSDGEQQDLWDCVFLSVAQIQELLEHVRSQPLLPFVYPMFCFAAHTGARRSEMIRLRIPDIDFEGKKVLLREKKRGRGLRTHRHVPLSPFLATALQEWLAKHPGGQEVFMQELIVARSKTKRDSFGPLTRNEAHDHFKRATQESRWDKLRGWHVFRHSFASNCAARSVDQRLIDAWMGHQTDEMRKRYRHLFPNQEQAAILSVFSSAPVSAIELAQ